MKQLFYILVLCSSFLFMQCQNPPLPEEVEEEETESGYYIPEEEEVTPYTPTNKPNHNGNKEEKEHSEDNNESENTYEPDEVFSVKDFLTKDFPTQIWVSGYIVGACRERIGYATFTMPFKWKSAILIADSLGETNQEKLLSIQLKSGTKARKELNLVDHPENVGRKIKVFGFQNVYLGIAGVKDWGNGYEWLK